MATKRRILNRNRDIADQVQVLGATASLIRRASNQMLLRKSELEELARDPHIAEDRFLEATKLYARRARESVSYLRSQIEDLATNQDNLEKLVRRREHETNRCTKRAWLYAGDDRVRVRCSMIAGHEEDACNFAVPVALQTFEDTQTRWGDDGPDGEPRGDVYGPLPDDSDD